EEDIKDLCPRLADDPTFEQTSDFDAEYNCFGHAARERRKWDPSPDTSPSRGGLFWPEGVPLVDSSTYYIQAFATIGYEQVGTPNHEPGYEKIALYVDSD